MKEYLVILFVIQLSFAAQDRCGNGEKHQYPGDNTKFIICENHIPLAKKCPTGLIFNHRVQVCEIPGAIDGTTTGRVEVNTVFPSSNTNQYENRPIYSNRDSAINGGYNGNTGNRGNVRYHNNQNNNDGFTSGHSDSISQQRNPEFGNHFAGSDLTGSSSTVHSGVHQGQLGYTHTATRPGHSGVIYNGESRDSIGAIPTFKPNQNGITTGDLITGYQNQLPEQGHYNPSTVPTFRPDSHSGVGAHVVTGTDYVAQGTSQHQHYDYNTKQNGGYQGSGVKTSYDHGYKSGNYENNQRFDQQSYGHHDHVNLNVITGSTGHSAESCRSAAMGEHLPYPGDCNKFIVCMETGVTVKSCPPGTHFNARLQICDWPNTAMCHYNKFKY